MVRKTEGWRKQRIYLDKKLLCQFKMLKIKFTIQEFGQNAILLVFVLLSLNFQAKFFYFAYAAFVLLCFTGKVYVHSEMIPYLIIGVLISITHSPSGMLAMLRPISYVLLYCVGYNLVLKVRKNEQNEIHNLQAWFFEKVIFSISFGSFLHYLLNFAINYGKNIGRNTIDIWSGIVMSATGQAALACLMVGYSLYLILVAKTVKKRIAGWGIAVIILGYNLILAGRTLVVIYFVLLIIGILYLLGEKEFAAKYKLLGKCASIILIAYLVYSNNLGGVQDIVEESNLYARFAVRSGLTMDTGRTDAKMLYIKNFYRYPFGGLNMRSRFGYAHDLLLDAYDEFSILIVFPLIYILWSTVKRIWQILSDDTYNLQFRMCLLLVYSSIHILFCLEPIFAGMQWLFASYCLMNGCLDGLRRYNAGVRFKGDVYENPSNKHGIRMGKYR